MVLVSMRQHDATHVGELNAVSAELLTKGLGGLIRFWPDVDQRQRVLADEVNVDVADVKRRWDRDGDDLHHSVLDQLLAA